MRSPTDPPILPDWQRTANAADGWLTRREARLLYEMGKRCTGRGVIVEIGSWKGKSTIWLAHGSLEGARMKVYAIDPHTGITKEHAEGTSPTFADFQRNIQNAGVDALVVPILKTSEDAAKDFSLPVEAIFIDGNHDEASVQQDFDTWFPKVIEGGFMAFHDTIVWPGPKQVVRRAFGRTRRFRYARFANSLSLAEKVKRNSLVDVCKNQWMLLRKFTFEWLFRSRAWLLKLRRNTVKKLPAKPELHSA